MSREAVRLEQLAQRVRSLGAFARAGVRIPADSFDDTSAIESVVAATIAVSRECGSPLADALSSAAGVCSNLADHLRQVGATLAGPRLARIIILAMPVVAALLTVALGFDIFSVLLGSWFGWMLVTLSVLLTWGGDWWTRRLIVQASVLNVTVGTYARLIAVALAAGVGLSRARAVVGRAFASRKIEPDPSEVSACDQLNAMTQRSGVPLRFLLVSLDESLRSQELALAGTRLGQLGEKLLLPIGCCALPAFLCAGVVPAIVSVVSATTSLR